MQSTFGRDCHELHVIDIGMRSTFVRDRLDLRLISLFLTNGKINVK